MKAIYSVLLLFPVVVLAEPTISKSEWTGGLVAGIPPALCIPTQPFLSCYNTDAAGCTNVMKVVTKECIKAIPGIPDMIPVSDSKKWGFEVGKCVGQAYTIAMTNAGHKKANCP